jgi:hypothetical protein
VNGTESGFSVVDTFGCDEDQIIDIMELGKGHEKFGIPRGVLLDFISMFQALGADDCMGSAPSGSLLVSNETTPRSRNCGPSLGNAYVPFLATCWFLRGSFDVVGCLYEYHCHHLQV